MNVAIVNTKHVENKSVSVRKSKDAGRKFSRATGVTGEIHSPGAIQHLQFNI